MLICKTFRTVHKRWKILSSLPQEYFEYRRSMSWSVSLGTNDGFMVWRGFHLTIFIGGGKGFFLFPGVKSEDRWQRYWNTMCPVESSSHERVNSIKKFWDMEQSLNNIHSFLGSKIVSAKRNWILVRNTIPTSWVKPFLRPRKSQNNNFTSN